MISRNCILFFSIAAVTVCFAAPLISDTKTGEDDGIKISLEKLKFIPAELLCTLCHRVVIKLQHDLQENPLDFQVNMLKSCDNYPELEDQVKCRAAFTNRQKIEQLLDPEAPTKMCRSKMLCKSDELPLPPAAFPMPGPPQGMQPIPRIPNPRIPNQHEQQPNETSDEES